MSGPVSPADAPATGDHGTPGPAPVEILTSRTSRVGHLDVRRALPRRGHRTVGAWCFADHLGPATAAAGDAGIGPHPHVGLQTVTWLLAGRFLHRDSLGSEQLIRPGQLNLMTAGAGVVHAEEDARAQGGELHGVQLWVAQPQATRHGRAAFEHHAELPRVDLDGGATATVLVGDLAGATSPARRDTDHVGADLDLHPGATTVPLRRDHEHALVVLTGAVTVAGDGTVVGPGHLAYLAPGRDELALAARHRTRALLLGGVPFGEDIVMWWNFVARTPDEIDAAATAWRTGDGRFGPTGSALPRIPAPARP
jgi:redox-sensitive bicupin YhaK (pirin superfamily)